MWRCESSRGSYCNIHVLWLQLISCLLVLFVASVIWNPKSEILNVPRKKQKVCKSPPSEDPGKKFISNYIRNPPIVMWTERTTKAFKSKPLVCNGRNVTCEYFPNSILIPPNITGAYLFYGTTIKVDDWPLPRNPNNIIWGLFHDESPKNVDILLHEKGLKLFNYSSTFSKYSDVPFPLMQAHSLSKITNRHFYVNTSIKNSLLAELSPILYLQSICSTYTDRDLYVQQLMRYQRIDSFGKCLNNKKMTMNLKRNYLQNLNSNKFFEFVARYKFVIAIENGVCDNYISEKFWRAIHLGVVPIYFGSPSIRDWLPNKKSAILIEDFATPQLLSAHIDDLMQNDDLYEEYLEHKTKGIVRNQNILNEINERPHQIDFVKVHNEFSCFLCEKLHKINEMEPYRVINKQHYNCVPSKSALTLKLNPENVGYNTFMLSKPIVERIYHDIKKQFK